MNSSLQDLASNSSKGIILTFITDILQLVNTGKERAKVSLLMTWAVLATTFPWVFAPNLYFMICWIWSCSILDAMLEFYRRTFTSFWGSRKWAIHVRMMSQKLNMFSIASAPCSEMICVLFDMQRKKWSFWCSSTSQASQQLITPFLFFFWRTSLDISD